MTTIIKLKRGYAVDWASTDPILAYGEPGFERDTGLVKVGDGVRSWKSLPYTGIDLEEEQRRHGVIIVTNTATLIPTETSEQFNVTEQAGSLTIAAPVTPANLIDGQSILFRIKDDGTPRDISWDAIYRAVGVILPLITVTNKVTYVGGKWNAAAMKYDIIAVGQEL